MSAGDWEKGAEILYDAAERLERGGADFIIICTNTWHKYADQIQQRVTVPILHVAEVTAAELLEEKNKNRCLAWHQIYDGTGFL